MPSPSPLIRLRICVIKGAERIIRIIIIITSATFYSTILKAEFHHLKETQKLNTDQILATTILVLMQLANMRNFCCVDKLQWNLATREHPGNRESPRDMTSRARTVLSQSTSVLDVVCLLKTAVEQQILLRAASEQRTPPKELVK